MKKSMVVGLVLMVVLAAQNGASIGQEISIKALPPSVVKTVPVCGATNVDPNLHQS